MRAAVTWSEEPVSGARRGYDCDQCSAAIQAERQCSKRPHAPLRTEGLIKAGVGRGARQCERLELEANPEWWRYIEAYADYDRGNLLRRGGLDDQPVRWLQAMRVVSQAVSTVRAEILEAQRGDKGYREQTTTTRDKTTRRFAGGDPVTPPWGRGLKRS